MKKVTIAIDVDGTLIQNGGTGSSIVANERVRTLLIALASMKNTRIIVWSGGGETWARQAARAVGVAKYVDSYADKHILPDVDGHPRFDPDFTPDIAIDDIQECELGLLNLIVKEK